MNDRKKVIEALEACVLKDPDDSRDCRHCPRCNYGAFITNSCINGVMADCLSLLKEQEPLEPIRKVIGCGWRYFCGKCSNSLVSQQHFCQECGQAVKWE